MALLFIEGFDQYASTSDFSSSKYSSTNVPAKWVSSSSGTISTTVFRTAQPGGTSKSYRVDANSSGYANLQIPTTTEIYIGFNFRVDTLAWSHPFINLTTTLAGYDGGLGLRMGYNIDGSIYVQRMNNSTNLFTTLANTIIINTWYYMELKVVCGASGSVELRIEGLTVGSATSVDTKGGITGAGYDYVKLTNGTSGPCYHYFDDFYVCDNLGTSNNSWLGPCSVYTLFPNSNGTTNNMTANGAASNWDCVNDTAWDTTTYVSTSATNDIDYYNVDNLGVAPTSIYGVMTGTVAAKGTYGLRKVRNKIKVGANVTNGSLSQELLYLNYLRQEELLEKQPDGSDWNSAAVDALEVGVEAQ